MGRDGRGRDDERESFAEGRLEGEIADVEESGRIGGCGGGEDVDGCVELLAFGRRRGHFGDDAMKRMGEGVVSPRLPFNSG